MEELQCSEGHNVEEKTDIACRLAHCITFSDDQLGDTSVIEAIAKNLQVEVYGTSEAFEGGAKKEFTQYRMDVSLMDSRWAVETRWSHLEALEKKLAKTFSALIRPINWVVGTQKPCPN